MAEQGGSPDAEQVTGEWPAIRDIEPGWYERVEYELIGHLVDHAPGVLLRADFEGPVELRLGRDEQTPPCFLERAERYPELADGAKLLVVQPTVVRADLTRGWVRMGGSYPPDLSLGRERSPNLQLGPDVSREHCYISQEGKGIDISNYGRNGLRVVVARSDLAPDLDMDAFNPIEQVRARIPPEIW